MRCRPLSSGDKKKRVIGTVPMKAVFWECPKPTLEIKRVIASQQPSHDFLASLDIRREALEESISTTVRNDHYFEESLGVYSMLFLTGNFPNPMMMPASSPWFGEALPGLHATNRSRWSAIPCACPGGKQHDAPRM